MRRLCVLLTVVMLTSGSAETFRSPSNRVSTRGRQAVAPPVVSLPQLRPNRIIANQHEGHTGAAPIRLSLAVDGAVNSAAISAELAYGHFLSAMASLENAKGRDAALKNAGLTSADRRAFIVALGSLGAELKAIEAQRKASSAFDSLRLQHNAVLETARNRVQSALSRQGAATLHDYIETRVKPRIRIFRGGSPTAVPELVK
jgi:hypothetical protein